MMAAAGTAVPSSSGHSALSDSTSSRWSLRRRSTMDSSGTHRGGLDLIVEEVDQLRERAAGEGGGHDGDEQRVGRPEHALAGQRDAGRAVEQGQVVVVPERLEEIGQPLDGALGALEVEVEVAQGEVGWHDVHRREVGAPDVTGQRAVGAHQPAAPAPHLGPHAEQVGGGALRVEVPHEHPHAGPGRLEGQVHRGAGLPHAAFDAVGGGDLHASATSTRSPARVRRLALVS